MVFAAPYNGDGVTDREDVGVACGVVFIMFSVVISDRSRHANCVTPARYSRREYVPDRNPRSRTLSCTMTWLQHRTSLVGQTNDRRASVVRRS
jgi:hypothetical protein